MIEDFENQDSSEFKIHKNSFNTNNNDEDIHKSRHQFCNKIGLESCEIYDLILFWFWLDEHQSFDFGQVRFSINNISK